MKLQKNSPYSNLNVTWQFEFVLNQVLLVDSTSLAYSSADNGWELKVYSCNHHPSLDPGQSFTVIKQIHNHVMPLKIPIQPIHTHCIPMHMTLFIGSYANSYHSTNGLEWTPSHKPHVDQRPTPIPTYRCDKSKWHSTLGGLHREKQFKNKTLIRLPHAKYIWWPYVW